MSSDTTPALPTLYPTYVKLLCVLEPDENDPNCVTLMKEKAKQNLEKRYENTPDVLLFSSFLHPLTKQLNFISTEEKAGIHAKIKEELKKLAENDVTHSAELESPPAKRFKCENTLFDWLDDIVKPSTSENQESRETKCDVEFMHYLSEPDSKQDPLLWWKTKESVFPFLSKLAKKYLCIPASSVPSERIFSTAGYLVNRQRAALSADNVDMLLFLHKNMNQLQLQ